MSRELKKGKLLVIDDDSGMRSLLTDVFADAGYTVVGLPDPTAALQLIKEEGQKVDAVVCDLNMPRMSGIDFLELLRQTNTQVPVILVTAFGTNRIAKEAHDKGAFGYLSKPFKLTEIIALIHRAVASAQAS